MPKNKLVLDTNIILLDAHNLITLGGENTIVVLPETVIDELDAKKEGRTELAYQAREFGRLLTAATTEEVRLGDTMVTTILSLEGVTIHVIALDEYNIPMDTHPKVINDRKIIEVARRLQGDITTFMSNDVMCRLRAQAFGLSVIDFKVVEKTVFEFTKTFEVSPDDFAKLHNAHIIDIDPNYKQENYNYRFGTLDSAQIKLATISKGIINVLGKATEDDLRRQDVNPKNTEQLFFSRAIQDTDVDIVVCEALAGSGKTLMAISNAMKLVRQKKYSSIVYFRASVDDVDESEEVGFLSGNEEKFAVYFGPLEDSLNFIARSRNKSSKLKAADLEIKIAEVIEDMREKYNISGVTGLGMRGRTFDDTIFIIDEAQGQTPASLQKVITRQGSNNKLIIIGSNNQIDNKYINKYTNGLSKILNDCAVLSDKVIKHAVTLTRVERGKIAEWGEDLFTKE